MGLFYINSKQAFGSAMFKIEEQLQWLLQHFKMRIAFLNLAEQLIALKINITYFKRFISPDAHYCEWNT